jgi:hypothetical protein
MENKFNLKGFLKNTQRAIGKFLFKILNLLYNLFKRVRHRIKEDLLVLSLLRSENLSKIQKYKWRVINKWHKKRKFEMCIYTVSSFLFACLLFFVLNQDIRSLSLCFSILMAGVGIDFGLKVLKTYNFVDEESVPPPDLGPGDLI